MYEAEVKTDFECFEPIEKRWDPLGAANDNDSSTVCEEFKCNHHTVDAENETLVKLKNLEIEHESLNSSLFALTTHFAQLQFRLRQIVNAPFEERETLLKSVEEFAFRGVPDIASIKDSIDEANLTELVQTRSKQQTELIERLKSQLKELEQYAFENGEAIVPQDVLIERQKVIVDELKTRMNFDIDEKTFSRMTADDVKRQLNVAVDQLVSPLRLKEHMVGQLKTQVEDLERYINYLQKESVQKKCDCGRAYRHINKPIKNETMGIIHKTAALLQMFTILQLRTSANTFKVNQMKKSMKVNHWGDLRAKLEIAIIRVKDSLNQSKITESSDPHTHTAVRKYLAPSIRDLVQHGTVRNPQTMHTASLVPFIGCLPRTTNPMHTQPPTPPATATSGLGSSEGEMHAWEIVLAYYHMKGGEQFNSTPARRLSRSYNLEIAGATLTSNKHNLLCAIGNVISTHTRYKRSYDAQFKAFISAALNANKLVSWLSLIFQSSQVVKAHYLPWSYVAKTNFQDSLKSLDSLTAYTFNLPVDIAVRQFQNIKDIFT